MDIEVSQQAGDVSAEVRDWGCGFDVAALRNGYGLNGICYRSRALQGTADIADSSPRRRHAHQRAVSDTARRERRTPLNGRCTRCHCDCRCDRHRRWTAQGWIGRH